MSHSGVNDFITSDRGGVGVEENGGAYRLSILLEPSKPDFATARRTEKKGAWKIL